MTHIRTDIPWYCISRAALVAASAGGLIGGAGGVYLGSRAGTKTSVALGGAGFLAGSTLGPWALWSHCEDRSVHPTLWQAKPGQWARRVIAENNPSEGLYSDPIQHGKDQLRVHYFEAGPKDRPPLLLVHGFGGNAYQFSQIFDELAREYHVIAIDLPGWGYSDTLPGHNYDFDRDLRPILNKFLDQKGLKNVTVVANSLGCPIAQSLAVDNARVAALILFASLEPQGKGSFTSWQLENLVAGGLDSTNAPFERLAAFTTLALYAHPTLTTIRAADIEQYILPYTAGSGQAEMVQARKAYAKLEARFISDRKVKKMHERLQQKLEQPVLIVQSEFDGFVSLDDARDLEGKIPNSELLFIPLDEVPTAGHSLMNDTPDLAIKIVRDFMGGRSPLSQPSLDERYLVFRRGRELGPDHYKGKYEEAR